MVACHRLCLLRDQGQYVSDGRSGWPTGDRDPAGTLRARGDLRRGVSRAPGRHSRSAGRSTVGTADHQVVGRPDRQGNIASQAAAGPAARGAGSRTVAFTDQVLYSGRMFRHGPRLSFPLPTQGGRLHDATYINITPQLRRGACAPGAVWSPLVATAIVYLVSLTACPAAPGEAWPM
jgi:hypothetical protein